MTLIVDHKLEAHSNTITAHIISRMHLKWRSFAKFTENDMIYEDVFRRLMRNRSRLVLEIRSTFFSVSECSSSR